VQLTKTRCRYLCTIILVFTSMLAMAQTPDFPDSVSSYLQFEKRTCAEGMKATISPCKGGLAMLNEGGHSCLVGIHYWNGQKSDAQYNFRQCVYSCERGSVLNGSDLCSYDPCNLKFDNRAVWRAARALEAEDGGALANLYKNLLDLIKASESGDRATYAKLGGDQERIRVKRGIVDVVLDKMIPYTACETPQMDRSDLEYPTRAPDSFAAGGPGDLIQFKPLGLGLMVFEAAFVGRDHGTPYANPDLLAAAFIHESYHYAQPREMLSSSSLDTAKMCLEEVAAYEYSSISTFYKIVLRDHGSAFLENVHKIYIPRFQKAWAALSQSQRKDLATWAWGDKRMRRMMNEYPAWDEGVWGELCTQNGGMGVCGRVNSQR
jgi:hypothetical protein